MSTTVLRSTHVLSPCSKATATAVRPSPHILVVSADEQLTAVTEKSLQHRGTLIVKGNRAAGFFAAKDNLPEIVLLDCDYSDRTDDWPAFETIHGLRTHTRTSGIRLLVVCSDEKTAETAGHLGVWKCVLRQPGFIATIGRLLGAEMAQLRIQQDTPN